MDLLDRVAAQRLSRQGFWSVRVPGRLGVHHLLDGPGTGALPPLVMLHGFGSRSTHLHGLIQRLQPHFSRIIVPDLLGHGGSDPAPGHATGNDVAEALFDTLDEVVPGPAVVFGNSLGGLCGIRYAARRPSRVAGLLVTSPGGAPLPPDQHEAFLRRFAPETIEEARALVDLAFAQTPRFADLMARSLHARFSVPSVRAMLAKLTHDETLRPHEVAGLTVPTTVVWGAAEHVLLEEHRAFFAAHLPAHAQLVQPENYGHVAYMEQADDLAARIVAFAEGLSARVAA